MKILKNIEVPMKLKVDNTFKPITITLETQDELDQMYGLSSVPEIYTEIPIFREIADKLFYSNTPSENSEKYLENIKNLLK